MSFINTELHYIQMFLITKNLFDTLYKIMIRPGDPCKNAGSPGSDLDNNFHIVFMDSET